MSVAQSPTSSGMVPVIFASEITSVLRNLKEERFEGNGFSRGRETILISETNPAELHVMQLQLHGLASFAFQSDKASGGEDEECSHE